MWSADSAGVSFEVLGDRFATSLPPESTDAARAIVAGATVFNGAAVRVGARVVAIVGLAGAGCSTIAARLVLAGHDLVADGIVAVEHAGGDAVIVNRTPHLCLWNDVVEELGVSPVAEFGEGISKFRWTPGRCVGSDLARVDGVLVCGGDVAPGSGPNPTSVRQAGMLLANVQPCQRAVAATGNHPVARALSCAERTDVRTLGRLESFEDLEEATAAIARWLSLLGSPA